MISQPDFCISENVIQTFDMLMYSYIGNEICL